MKQTCQFKTLRGFFHHVTSGEKWKRCSRRAEYRLRPSDILETEYVCWYHARYFLRWEPQRITRVVDDENEKENEFEEAMKNFCEFMEETT